jgi:CheY-like chemotaxis protein
MTRVRLIHWNAAEAAEHANRLALAGHEVVHDVPRGRELLAELRDRPVQAIVIDLSRLPAQGRDLALMLRQFKPTRHVPIVFVGGDPAKIAGIRRLLPDAGHSSWSRIRGALRHAIAHPPSVPVVHRSVFAAYAGAEGLESRLSPCSLLVSGGRLPRSPSTQLTRRHGCLRAGSSWKEQPAGHLRTPPSSQPSR